jgi:hypothetical protein
MRYLVVVLLFSFIIFVEADQHLHANGPFGKRHLPNDEPSPHTCNRTSGVSSTTVDLITLNVTATGYSSNEQINVTWTSTSTSCTDDFIGIYFTEISHAKGKNIHKTCRL